MKYRFLSLLFASITVAAALVGCGEPPKDTVTADEKSTVVSTADSAPADASVAETETATQQDPTAEATAATIKPAVKKPKPTQEETTQSATVQANIPKDNITGSNINPNLSAIQAQVAEDMKALAVKSIRLSSNSLTIATGESAELALTFNPENAAVKSCSLTVSSGCVVADFLGNSKIVVTGKSAGTCTLTVTSHNGHKAYCDITVKRAEQEITDDTVLSHKELCTADNATRWRTAIAQQCALLGMKENTALRGASFSINTADDQSARSYNAAEKAYVQQVLEQVELLTNGEYESYEFNCISEPQDGEYIITVIVNKIEP